MDAIVLALVGAAVLAAMSAAFGAGLARILWAEDLKQAQYIDEIRSKTEGHLRKTIEILHDKEGHLRETVEAQARTIEILRAK